MERLHIYNNMKNACYDIVDIKENVLYQIDNKQLYIRKRVKKLKYIYDIISYNTTVGYIIIKIDYNENIKHIQYNYTGYKYSVTTTRHVNYVNRIVHYLGLLECCNVDTDISVVY